MTVRRSEASRPSFPCPRCGYYVYRDLPICTHCNWAETTGGAVVDEIKLSDHEARIVLDLFDLAGHQAVESMLSRTSALALKGRLLTFINANARRALGGDDA